MRSKNCVIAPAGKKGIVVDPKIDGNLYKMVTQNMLRMHGRIGLPGKKKKDRFATALHLMSDAFNKSNNIICLSRACFVELPSNISIMQNVVNVKKM